MTGIQKNRLIVADMAVDDFCMLIECLPDGSPITRQVQGFSKQIELARNVARDQQLQSASRSCHADNARP